MITIERTVSLSRMGEEEDLTGVAWNHESGGHKFVISCADANGEVALSGTVTGTVVKSDGTTVELTGNYAGIESGKAWVQLPGNAYDTPGAFTLTVVHADSDSNMTVIYSARGFIRTGETTRTVTPGNVINVTALQTLINETNAAKAQAIAASAYLTDVIAPDYNPPYTANECCTHNGKLYRALQDVASGAAWDASAWEAVNMSDFNRTLEALIDTVNADNLYTGTGLTAGKRLSSTGSEVDANAYAITDYIPVVAGITYEYSRITYMASSAYAMFYDKDKTVISGSGVVLSVGKGTVTAPDGAWYVRCTVGQTSLPDVGSTTTTDTANFVFRLYLPACEEKKADALAAGVTRHNIYDKNSTDRVEGYYLNSTGIPTVLSAWCITGYLPVCAGYTYHFSGVTRALSTRSFYFFYRADKSLILPATDCLLTEGSGTITAPDGAYYVRFTLSVTYGDYDTFFFALARPAGSSCTLEVSPDGTKPFLTIHDAYDYAASIQEDMTFDERKENRFTILIYPGTYDEVVETTNTPEIYPTPYSYPNGRTEAYPWGLWISFVGVNKRDVIWKNTTGDYRYAPLHTNNPCLIKGITFIADHTSYESEAAYKTWVDTFIQTQANNYGCYALHLDDPRSNKTDDAIYYSCSKYESVVEDCDFYSYQHAAIGAGLHANQTVRIRNCGIYTIIPDELLGYADSIKGALLFHGIMNAPSQYDFNELEQRFIVEDCRIECNERRTLYATNLNYHTDGDGNSVQDTEVIITNCSFWSDYVSATYGEYKNTARSIQGTIYEYFSDKCFGNNVAVLNIGDPNITDVATSAETLTYLGITT